MKPAERAKQLTADHWGYVGKTLEVHGIQPEELAIIRHHYVTSGQHFYLHAVEDCANGMFAPVHGVPAAIADVKRDTLCADCYDQHACGGVFITSSGGCIHQRVKPPLRERMMDAQEGRAKSLCDTCQPGTNRNISSGGEPVKAEAAPLCKSCGVKDCESADPWRNICSLYVPKDKPAPVALEICPSCDQHPGCKGTVEPAEDGSCKGFSAKEAASDAL